MKQKAIAKFAAAVLCCSAFVPVSVQAQDLIFSTFLSSEHHLTKNLFNPFAAELTEKANGSMSMEVVSGGALAKSRETLAAISNGAIDAGYVIDIYTPSLLPETALLADLALQISDAKAATAAMNETVLLDCPECRESLATHNVVPLGYISTSTYHLYCTSAITKLEDFKGKRFRATSAWAPLIENLGGTPVSVPTSELFEGLQRGALDCSVGPVSHLQSYSLFDLVTDVNEFPIGAYAGSLVLNLRKEVWDGLSDEQRALMIDLAPKYVTAGIFSYVESADVVAAEGKEKGIKFNPAADDLKQAYADHNKSALAAAIKKGTEELNLANSEAMINKYIENLEKWKGIVAEVGSDKDAYEKALRDEIYSKL